jgi:urease accessory protein
VSWKARLSLRYTRDGERTTAHDRHSGPLRVLQRLYPEGPAICHHVIVHPPGGVVGGDVLEVDGVLEPGTHAVLTTPGATRFYRTAGALALQSTTLTVGAGARVEWLPLETIAYRGCDADARLTLQLAPDAEAIGWDVVALGLPAAGDAFDVGRYRQRIEIPGVWLERGVVDGADRALLDGAPGLAGRRVVATAWFAAGAALPTARRDALLDAARAEVDTDAALPELAGATCAQPPVIVVRALADRVEPALGLLMRVRAAWRQAAGGLAACPPRVWKT